MKKVDDWCAWWLPRRCVLCNAVCGGVSVCPGCCADLPWIEPQAGLPGWPAQAEGSSGASAGRPDRLVAALAYEFPVDRMIMGAKFRGQLHFAQALGELLVRVLVAGRTSAELPQLLVPVPLHRHRLVERGYNQALEIARPVARTLGLKLAPTACERIRPTVEQTGLSAAGRRRNLRGAFRASGICRGRSVAVLDDVVTTGSTVSAVVAAVRAAGALTVEVWAAARTL